MLRILKMIFCKHDYRFKRTLHGDMCHHLGGRSEWVCTKCEKREFSWHMDKLG
ncbi:hypothetical protein JEO87_06115 [Acinetobacter pittii]|uniref:hypothetical protein n=1 Tax=Acinetobacter pittii TaxID=48296 RepID=UPI0019016F6C|nr:hypothetical protein [Acinetobacter pittii]MBK0410084.1 hypothetical protein [Acinetobacter pittii]